MNLTRRRLCASVMLAAWPMMGRAASATLTIGLFPNLPAHRLIELYQPLANYLAQQLNCPVRLFSAKDFRSFYEATRNNQFDVVVTAPHLAWLAMVESGWRPLTTFTRSVTGVVVVRRNSNVIIPSNCRGKVVAMVDPLTIVSQLGLGYFKSSGLTANVDYRLTNYRNHADVALAVMLDKADCGVVGKLPFQQMVVEVSNKLRVIGETQSEPSQFVMTNPHVSPALFERMRTALIQFNHVPSGVAFIQQQQVGAIIVAESKALTAVAPYARATQMQLQRGHE